MNNPELEKLMNVNAGFLLMDIRLLAKDNGLLIDPSLFAAAALADLKILSKARDLSVEDLHKLIDTYTKNNPWKQAIDAKIAADANGGNADGISAGNAGGTNRGNADGISAGNKSENFETKHSGKNMQASGRLDAETCETKTAQINAVQTGADGIVRSEWKGSRLKNAGTDSVGEFTAEPSLTAAIRDELNLAGLYDFDPREPESGRKSADINADKNASENTMISESSMGFSTSVLNGSDVLGQSDFAFNEAVKSMDNSSYSTGPYSQNGNAGSYSYSMGKYANPYIEEALLSQEGSGRFGDVRSWGSFADLEFQPAQPSNRSRAKLLNARQSKTNPPLAGASHTSQSNTNLLNAGASGAYGSAADKSAANRSSVYGSANYDDAVYGSADHDDSDSAYGSANYNDRSVAYGSNSYGSSTHPSYTGGQPDMDFAEEKMPIWKQPDAVFKQWQRPKVFYAMLCEQKLEAGLKDLLGNVYQMYAEQLFEIARYASKDMIAAGAVQMFSRQNFGSSLTNPPYSVCNLICQLMYLKPGEDFLDLGSSFGNMMIEAGMEFDTDVTCIDEVEVNAQITRLRSYILGLPYPIRCENPQTAQFRKLFDKCFVHIPSKLKIWGTKEEVDLIEISSEHDVPASSNTKEWSYAGLAMEHLRKKGMAVILTTESQLWRTSDIQSRTELLQKGVIRAVIALSSNLMVEHSDEVFLLVLENCSHKTVMMVDATHIWSGSRTKRWLSQDNIDEIMRLLRRKGLHSKKVSVEDIISNNGNLTPDYYVNAAPDPVHAVELKSVCTRIAHGKLSSKDITPEKGGNIILLSSANLQNGVIDLSEKCQETNTIPTARTNCLVQNGDLLMNRSGSSIKTAVGEVPKGMQMLTDGSIYLMHLDQEKINPYFLQAYFETEEGAAVLSRLPVGSTIKSIQLQTLKKLLVPCPDMLIQNSIAEEYKKARTKYQKAAKELKAAEKARQNIYNKMIKHEGKR